MVFGTWSFWIIFDTADGSTLQHNHANRANVADASAGQRVRMRCLILIAVLAVPAVPAVPSRRPHPTSPGVGFKGVTRMEAHALREAHVFVPHVGGRSCSDLRCRACTIYFPSTGAHHIRPNKKSTKLMRALRAGTAISLRERYVDISRFAAERAR